MNELVARWRRNPKLTKAVLRALEGGKSLGSLVDVVNGRADLRGIAFPGVDADGLGLGRPISKLQLRGRAWEHIDFTGSNLGSMMFFNCEFNDIVLHDVDFRSSGFWDCTIQYSEFVASDLRNACLSSEAKPTRWDNSVIRSSDLSGSSVVGGSFRNMEFGSLKGSRLSIERCSLESVRFTGVLREMQFDDRQLDTRTPPRLLDRVDFSKAAFGDVDFRGWRFKGVTLPEGTGWYPHQLRVSQRVLELVERSAPDAAPMIAVGVRNLLRGVNDDDIDGFYSPSEWQRIGKDGAVAHAYEAALVKALEEMGLSINWGQARVD